MRLLLIEDDPEIASLLRRYLEKQDFVVVHAADGKAGVASYEEAVAAGAAFDVVLTDGLLPKMNGYEVARAVRKVGAPVGLVLMSAAFRGANARRDSYDAGVDAFFNKPFVLTELRDKLRELAQRTTRARAGTGSTPPTTVKAAPAAPTGPFEVNGAGDVSRLLLRTSRGRFDGVLRFVAGNDELHLAFMKGVIVGASDNLREHVLGRLLHGQKRITDEQARALEARLNDTDERVAEALLALGFVSADEALLLVEQQTVLRVRRALTWRGTVEVVVGDAAALALATQVLDLADLLLAFGLDESNTAAANAFAVAHATEPLQRTSDFDAGLVAFARLQPTSPLPQFLLEGERSLGAAGALVGALPVYALWLAGLVRITTDGAPDARTVARALRGSHSSAFYLGLVDEEAVAAISQTLLRARNASTYALVQLPRSAPTADVLRALDDLNRAVGRDALVTSRLGPARSAARELWTLLEDARFTFSDEERRRAYDDDLAAADARLTGGGPLVDARAALSRWMSQHTDEADAVALRGHLMVKTGDREGGVALLVDAARRFPQSVRPLYFLGVLAVDDGDPVKARSFFSECARRAPDDVDVQRALRAMHPIESAP